MSAQVETPAFGSLPNDSQRTPWKEIFAASIGNALEFYDLLIYAYFAVQIGQLFFPSKNPVTSLLLSVATFGISFVTRPLGAIILGSYADRAGRKASLTMSISIMMVGTAMIAFTPAYSQIGIASTLIIVLARMLQGFSTGGEFGASTAFMVEHAGKKNRGLTSSWQMSTQGLATVLAAGVSTLLSYMLTPDQLNQWGWRVAFGFGLLIGPIGLYIRRQIEETPAFKKAHASAEKKHEKSPLSVVFGRDRVNMLLGMGVVAAGTAFTYIHKEYMPTYASQQLHIRATYSFLGAMLTGVILMVMAPIVGALSDRYGPFKVMLIALLMIICTSYPLFLVLNIWPTIGTLLIVQALVGVLIAATLGAMPALLADIFPTSTRGTGLALSYNFSVTLFGGFAPLIVTWMIAVTGNKLSPSFYVMTTAVISIVSVLLLGHRIARKKKTPS